MDEDKDEYLPEADIIIVLHSILDVLKEIHFLLKFKKTPEEYLKDQGRWNGTPGRL